MKWEETVASGCRWSEFAEEKYKDWDFVYDNSYCDYQGSAEFLAAKDGKYVHVEWSYGSCSGCDAWEDMPEADAKADFMNGVIPFDNVEQVLKWVEMLGENEKAKKIVNGLRYYILDEEILKLLKD